MNGIVHVVGELGLSLAVRKQAHGREVAFASPARCPVRDWDDLANVLAGLVTVEQMIAMEVAPERLPRDEVIVFKQLAAWDVA